MLPRRDQKLCFNCCFTPLIVAGAMCAFATTTARADVELVVDIKNSAVDGDNAYEFGSFGSAGLEVVRIWVSGIQPGDRFDVVHSTPKHPMTIATTDPNGFFNASNLFGQGSQKPSSAAYEIEPTLQWDTWFAIDDQDLFLLNVSDTALQGGGSNIVNNPNVAWMIVPPEYFPAETQVLIGQFAYGMDHDFEIDISVTVNRDGSSVLYENLTFTTAKGEPDPTGACCIDEECFLLTEADCDDADGEWDGSASCDGVDCSDDPPPPTEGACCLSAGGCIITTAADCGNQFGEFGGLGTTCGDIVCETGACCIEGECEMLTENFCKMFGTFNGAASCDGVQCNGEPDPTAGACCVEFVGECFIAESAVMCANALGTFGGVGTTCKDIKCGEPEPEEGACCSFGICFIGTEAACDVAEGEFGGLGTTCKDIVCEAPELEGACCVFGDCLLVTEATCDQAGGDFDGSPTCDAVECPVPDGVCCLHGACVPIDAEDCTALDGTFHPLAFSCADVICDPSVGACCINGAAIEIFDWQCELVQGEFMGSGIFAHTVDCPDPPPGGCPGDINLDGVVDLEDLIQLLIDMGCECIPNCIGKSCGSDGCGGSCGSCSTGYNCVDGQCIPKGVAKQLIGGGVTKK